MFQQGIHRKDKELNILASLNKTRRNTKNLSKSGMKSEPTKKIYDPNHTSPQESWRTLYLWAHYVKGVKNIFHHFLKRIPTYQSQSARSKENLFLYCPVLTRIDKSSDYTFLNRLRLFFGWELIIFLTIQVSGKVTKKDKTKELFPPSTTKVFFITLSLYWENSSNF